MVTRTSAGFRKWGVTLKNHVVIKSSKTGMNIILDPECTFDEILQSVAAKFRESARFWGNVQMALILEGRELTATEELQIIDAIMENSAVEILCLIDQDASRMERCEKALNQKLMELSSCTGQFYRGDLCRAETLESEASVVIIGDVQHGARVTAKGNIVILGELKGSAHAGVFGNEDAVIVALEMSPLQIRIASAARHYKDSRRRLGKGPMIAFYENGEISVRPLKKDFFSMLHLI